MRYEFRRVTDLLDWYRRQHEEAKSWVFLDILNAAIAELGAQVESVGYDAIGEPTMLLLRLP
jgi:hypothetical protein